MKTDALTDDAVWQILEARDLSILTAKEQYRSLQSQWIEAQKQHQHTQNALIAVQQELQQVQGALGQEKYRVAQLQDKLQSSEIVRARLIHEMRLANEQLKRHIQHLDTLYLSQQQINHEQQQRNHELEQKNNGLEQIIHELDDQLLEERSKLGEIRSRLKNVRALNKEFNQQNQSLSQTVEHLEQELARLSTGKAAVRQIIKKLLRKLGLFELIYNRHSSAVPIYNLLFRDRWSPATIAETQQAVQELAQPDPVNSTVQLSQSKSSIDQETTPTPEPQQPSVSTRETNQPIIATNEASQDRGIYPNIDMHTPQIEAFVVANSLGLEPVYQVETLEFFADLVTTVNKVLCIQPTQKVLPLLQSLAKHGAHVICVDCQEKEIKELQNYGLEATEQIIGNWMLSSNTFSLSDYDLVCLNNQMSQEDLHLLQARLSSRTRLIVTGATDRRHD